MLSKYLPIAKNVFPTKRARSSNRYLLTCGVLQRPYLKDLDSIFSYFMFGNPRQKLSSLASALSVYMYTHVANLGKNVLCESPYL